MNLVQSSPGSPILIRQNGKVISKVDAEGTVFDIVEPGSISLNELSDMIFRQTCLPKISSELLWSRHHSTKNADGKHLLTRRNWNHDTLFLLRTPRLFLRPIADQDITAFHDIAGELEIARMMINIEHPLTLQGARDWIKRRRFRGGPGFFVGIYTTSDPHLIGAIGFGALSHSLAYFISKDAWGQGYASEAIPAFMIEIVERYALKKIFAGVYTDNDPSLHLLEKYHFERGEKSRYASPARDSDDEIWEYECHIEEAIIDPETGTLAPRGDFLKIQGVFGVS